jgi:hypothetical protein
MEDILSSVPSTSHAGKNLSKFKYAELSTKSRPAFLAFHFDENALESFVANNIACRTSAHLKDIIKDISEKLAQIRSIFFSITRIDNLASNATWSEIRVQCIMQLFLNYIFKMWFDGVDIVVTAANENLIELIVVDKNGAKVKWSGYSDIKCTPVGVNILQAYAIIEMKVPLNAKSLFHSKALGPKQQLLGQTMGLLQQSNTESTFKLSFLTDMFALSVMHHVSGQVHLASRVTDEKGFCLRLLLMFCDLESLDLTGLMRNDVGAVCITEEELLSEDSLLPESKEDVFPSSEILPPAKCSRCDSEKKDRSGNENNAALCFSFGYDYEAAREEWLDTILSVRRWEAKCLGINYLGFDELQGLNSLNDHK